MFMRTVSIVALSTVALVLGCATGEDEEFRDVVGEDSVSETAIAKEAITVPIVSNNLLRDPYTSSAPKTLGTYVVNGEPVTMHVCPKGYAMLGAHVNSDVFMCVLVGGGMSGNRHVDQNTLRRGMHACPVGEVMVGQHVIKNLLLCEKPKTALVASSEITDSGTNDFNMHNCPLADSPRQKVMTGIHVINNVFLCTY
jgi:hypothetical protein